MKITEKQSRQIRLLLIGGHDLPDIAKAAGVSLGTVRKIRDGMPEFNSLKTLKGSSRLSGLHEVKAKGK